MTKDRVAVAKKLKQLLIESSPIIEEYTSTVCPGCTAVCCRQRHGLFLERDLWYLHALGVDAPPRDQARPMEGSCEMMGPKGCTQPRWLRPFKCTWYFCEPLLAALNEGPQRKVRKLSATLQEMIDLYNLLSASSGR
jgi:hypothetical protein